VRPAAVEPRAPARQSLDARGSAFLAVTLCRAAHARSAAAARPPRCAQAAKATFEPKPGAGEPKKRGRPRKSDAPKPDADDDDDEPRKKHRANQRSTIDEDGTWHPHLPLKRCAHTAAAHRCRLRTVPERRAAPSVWHASPARSPSPLRSLSRSLPSRALSFAPVRRGLCRYWQVELWQHFFTQLIHMPADAPRPDLAPIRAAFEQHLAQPAIRAELKAALARQQTVMDSRPASRPQLYRKIQAETLRKALNAVAADLGTPPPAESDETYVVPVELVQEALVEVFGVCQEPELVQALNKAVSSGKLANTRGGFMLAPLN
jgi:hypothetical protein